jgi:hypothetical protein
MADPCRKFWALFAVQCAATAVVLYNGIPFYRNLLLARQSADLQLYAMAVLCTVAGQLGYWLAMPIRSHANIHGPRPVGHLMLFAGRLVFTFASAMFTVVFYVKFDDLDIRVWKLALLLGLLFSLFCFTLQIEWLGRTMSDRPQPR